MKPFFAALSFLTILRLPRSWSGDATDLARSLPWFPLVGLLIGAGLVVLDALLRWLFPGLLLPSALLLVAMVAVSGGLHLDGLADSADAFMSSRPKEQMLEIMKDSRSGPMGVLAVVILLLLKFAALASLPTEWRAETLLLMPLAGRTALLLQTLALPYARSQGLVSLFTVANRYRQGALGLLPLSIAAVLLLGGSGVVLLLICLLAIWLLGRYCRAKIGGITGDTLGGSCELVELVPALVVLCCLRQGLLL